MLFLVGIGLGDVKDITVKGLEIVKEADKVYLEAYTSILCGDNNSKECMVWNVSCRKEQPTIYMILLTSFRLQETFYGKDIILADREFVESDSNKLLDEAVGQKIVLLVVGDPFGWENRMNLDVDGF